MSSAFQQLPLKTKLKIWFFTLFYHSQFSLDYTVDVLVEPVFWFVDNYTRFLGRFFVISVVTMVSLVTFVAHVLGLPFWWRRSPVVTIFLVVLGYWLLVNIFFNFYQALTVSPGQPDDPKRLISCSATICKTCISPKPPRTHHCSICKTCYLNMDHHCPWVNNCIGHFNRRYFYLTTAFITAGCIFVMIFGVELAFRFVFLGQDMLEFRPPIRHVNPRESKLPGPVVLDAVTREPELGSVDSARMKFLNVFGISIDKSEWEESLFVADVVLGLQVSRFAVKSMIFVAGFLCVGASVALGGLCWWHGRLISNGETSIEYHINKKNRQTMGDSYINLYDLGRKQNWILFLGLDQPGRTFWRHVLLPSTHVPTGDGYDWSHLIDRPTTSSPDLESELKKH